MLLTTLLDEVLLVLLLVPLDDLGGMCLKCCSGEVEEEELSK